MTTCEGGFDLAEVVVTVERHDLLSFGDEGDDVRFTGTVEVSDAGWQLRIPFDLTRSSGSTVDL